MIVPNLKPYPSELTSLSERLDSIKKFYAGYSRYGTRVGHEILGLPDELLTWLMGMFSGDYLPSPREASLWLQLLAIIRAQDSIGVLYHRIFHAPLSVQPPHAFITDIRRYYHEQSLCHLIYERQIMEIHRNLNDAGIRYLILKGFALGVQIYEKPAMRSFRDIDLFINNTDYYKAMETLKRIGYTIPYDEYHTIPGFSHHQIFNPPPGTCFKPVELHWRLLCTPEMGLSFHELYSESIPISSGSDIRTLSIRDAFIYASLHGGIHHAGEIRLIWISDIERLINVISTCHLWPEVLSRMERWQAGYAVHRSVMVTSWWMGSGILYGMPEINDVTSGKKAIITADRVRSGREHKIWSRLDRVPTPSGKLKVIYHYVTATRMVLATARSSSRFEHMRIWGSIAGSTIRSLLHSRRSSCVMSSMSRIRIILPNNCFVEASSDRMEE